MIGFLRDRSTRYRTLVVMIWITGFLTGYFTSIYTNSYSFLLMRSAVNGRLSIVGLFLSMLLPFLISAFLVRSTVPQLLFLIIFYKSFTFAYIATGITAAFGDAGWLVRILLMFADSFSVAFLFWFWLRNIDMYKRSVWTDLCTCVLCIACICIIDCFYITPFIQSLFL